MFASRGGFLNKLKSSMFKYVEALYFLEPRMRKGKDESSESRQKVRSEIMQSFEIWTLYYKCSEPFQDYDLNFPSLYHVILKAYTPTGQ